MHLGLLSPDSGSNVSYREEGVAAFRRMKGRWPQYILPVGGKTLHFFLFGNVGTPCVEGCQGIRCPSFIAFQCVGHAFWWLLHSLDLPRAHGASFCIQQRHIRRSPPSDALDEVEGEAMLQSVKG